MIIRENYLNTLINSKDKDYIKLLIGVRRSGKSTILKMMKNHLLSIGVLEEQIIEINYELMRFDELRDGKTLHDYINNKIVKGRKTYLFLDKVQ